jgi:hypothetical protein
MGDWIWVIVIAGFFFLMWVGSVFEEKNRLKDRNLTLESNNEQLNAKIDEWEAYSEELTNKSSDIERREQLFKQLFIERTQNFPIVGQIWSELIEVTESERARALQYKKHPALSAAKEVSAIKKEKRELIKELVSWKYKAQNYEAIYPWLQEELSQDIEAQVDADIYFSVYSKEEREDPVSTLISPDDYRKLSTTDRNQLALDRYWSRGKKTKWMIGKMYERYVGYLYEKDGWKVEYFGIQKRYEDLGRDLIAIKGDEVHVIQCKNWSRFKTIYENHIFQLFGTAFSMRDEYPKKKVIPVFYTSTGLSPTATEFARLLGIKVYENSKFENYPAVKCNISVNGDRIYHLPFDQQYDNIKITPKTGEIYAETVADAEAQGFRRAFRWKGTHA